MSKKNLLFGLLLMMGLIGFLNKVYFLETLPRKLWGNARYAKDHLIITLNTPATDLAEDSLNLNNMIRTANIYEGLVAFDPSLRIKPALAISWGNLNEKTWEFKLRQGVTFHDHTHFNADQVISSFEKAQKQGSSQIKGTIKNIEKIEKKDPFTLQIITYEPDPLLLSKLTKFYISQPGHIGTGPYKIKKWEKGKSLTLTGFPEYWGKRPAYRELEYNVIPERAIREKEFAAGNIDILVAVSRDQALSLPKEQVRNRYSLEVNFLMFKLDDSLMGNRAVREAIQTLFDPKAIQAIGNYFVRPANQFVAPGVYGYNADIQPFAYDKSRQAKNLFGQQRKAVTLDFLDTYRTLADYLKKQLEEAGFLVKLNAIRPEELLDRIKNNESQLFLIGWQAENGDAGEFLEQFIHSQGEFNGGRYQNNKVDQLIEQSRQEFNREKRLALLQEIMALIHEDLIGIPLFESSRLYAIKKGVEWEPRLDGLVLGAEVK